MATPSRRSRPSCRTAAPTSTASMPKCRKARGESGRPSTRSRSGRPAGVFTGAPRWGSPDPSRSTGAPRWGSPDPSGRSCLRAAPRRSLAGPVAVIAVEDDAQAVQGQPGVVALDGLADADHHRGQAAGGDHGRVVAQLGDHPPDQRVDLPGEAEDDARLERLRGVLADHRARRDQLDPAELGGLADQRVGGDLDPRRDRHPQHLAPPRDRVEGGGGAEIDHHRRPPVQRVGGHRVGHPVGADLARVVGQDRQARPDPGLQHQRLEAAVAPDHLAHGLAEPRHHRGDDHAGGGGAEVHTLLRQEPAEQQGVLVGGALRHGRHPPVLDQLVAVEHADGDLGVADVQCQQHGGSSYQSRPTSSEGAEWVRPPIDRKSTPVAATWRALARVIPPDASVRARPAAMATALDIMSRSMLSSSSSSQSTSSAWATSSRVSTSTSSGRPGPALRAAATAAASPPAVRMWLSLTRRASPRLMRWFWPPPARTAYLASWRSPGSVLRVSRITAPVPSTAATNAAVSVATPERWPSRLSSVRSAASTTLAGPATWPSSPPAATRPAVRAASTAVASASSSALVGSPAARSSSSATRTAASSASIGMSWAVTGAPPGRWGPAGGPLPGAHPLPCAPPAAPARRPPAPGTRGGGGRRATPHGPAPAARAGRRAGAGWPSPSSAGPRRPAPARRPGWPERALATWSGPPAAGPPWPGRPPSAARRRRRSSGVAARPARRPRRPGRSRRGGRCRPRCWSGRPELAAGRRERAGPRRAANPPRFPRRRPGRSWRRRPGPPGVSSRPAGWRRGRRCRRPRRPRRGLGGWSGRAGR